MTTIATGGFSSKSGSIGSYNNVNLEALTILFMILASLPFVLYLKAIRGKPKDLIGDQQVQGFFKILVVSILIVVFYLFLTSNFTFTEILRYSLFNVTSILIGTGFTSTNYNDWGTPIILLFLFITTQ